MKIDETDGMDGDGTRYVWLATRVEVDGATHEAARQAASEWLARALQREAQNAPPGVRVTRPPHDLTEVAVLAVQLATLEKRGGTAARRAAALRAEVDRLFIESLAPASEETEATPGRAVAGAETAA